MPARPQSSISTLLRGLLTRPLSARISIRMPGTSHRGPLPPLTPAQADIASRLRVTVEHLAGNIGERNVFTPSKLAEAEVWLDARLARLGFKVNRQPYPVRGIECANLWIDIPGSDPVLRSEIVLIGAHYDSIRNCPAANDNATGVAATLELAEQFAVLPEAHRPARTLRFALFANEEPPHFWTEDMGSLVMARACRARGDNIIAMLTPETIGYYSDEPGSQKYPLPLGNLYPDAGNFIAFIGIAESYRLVKQCVAAFRAAAAFPSEAAALPQLVPGVGSSDHWSFWKMGYPALMVTDTAPFRYAHYHTPEDTPDKIDYEKTARVVEGLRAVVADLSSVP